MRGSRLPVSACFQTAGLWARSTRNVTAAQRLRSLLEAGSHRQTDRQTARGAARAAEPKRPRCKSGLSHLGLWRTWHCDLTPSRHCPTCCRGWPCLGSPLPAAREETDSTADPGQQALPASGDRLPEPESSRSGPPLRPGRWALGEWPSEDFLTGQHLGLSGPKPSFRSPSAQACCRAVHPDATVPLTWGLPSGGLAHPHVPQGVVAGL